MGRKGKKSSGQGAGPQPGPQSGGQQQGPPHGGIPGGPPAGGISGGPPAGGIPGGPRPGGFPGGPRPGGFPGGPRPGGFPGGPRPGGFPRGTSPGGFRQQSPDHYQEPRPTGYQQQSPQYQQQAPQPTGDRGPSSAFGNQHAQPSASLGQGDASVPAWGPKASVHTAIEKETVQTQSSGKKKKKGPKSESQETSKTEPRVQTAAEKETVQTQSSGKQGGKGPKSADQAQGTSKTEPVTKPEAKPEGNRKKGKQPAGGKPAEASTSAAAVEPPASATGKTLTKELVKAAPKYTVPKRATKLIQHNPKMVEKQIRIEVNYLPITIKDWKLPVFHYDVTFDPDKVKALFRPAMELMRSKHFPNRHPCFDGKKNLYAGRTPLFSGSTVRDSVKVFDEEKQQEKEYDITIKLADHTHQLTFNDLATYMKEGSSTEVPQDVIQACDIALRAGLYNRFIQVGRSFFSQRANKDLSGGLELWDGFYQSKVVAWQSYLNVDVANKAFPIDQDVISYLRSLRYWNESELNTGLSDGSQRELQKFIKGLKVLYMGDDQKAKRIYRVNGLGVKPIDHKFEITDGEKKKMTDVYSYFRDVKRITIKYHKLPLLHVGPPQKSTMVPMEFCRIIGRQVVMRKLDEMQTSNMVRSAATDTDTRKGRILNNIRLANYNADKTVSQEFGMSVGGNFTSVNSVVIKPPAIMYRNNKQALVRNGVWKMDNHWFINTPQAGLQNWAVLVKDERTHVNDIRNMIELFQRCGRNMGLDVAEPSAITRKDDRRHQTENHIRDNLLELQNKFKNLQIVVVVMGGRGDSYSSIKRASELKTGVLTQCLKPITVQRKMNTMTAVNILLKINSKVNGVNHSITGDLKPPVLQEPIMFVGADVTHPSPGSDGTVSIAAIATSFDTWGFRYKMMYHLQPPRTEIIRDLEETMIAHLNHFKKMNNDKDLPKRIMYYRDGVSEGQFSQVLGIELTAIKNACAKVYGDNKMQQPKVTFLVVQKRHHTRFFPNKRDGDGGRNNNVLAGTIVDSDITHPRELDFYLVSHQSIQGTARPTKYHVLWDEEKFEPDALELLTYYLCYMFSRCNRSVSYPAPTYYAHLGAERARAYWDGQRMNLGDLKGQQRNEGTIHANITDMFFV